MRQAGRPAGCIVQKLWFLPLPGIMGEGFALSSHARTRTRTQSRRDGARTRLPVRSGVPPLWDAFPAWNALTGALQTSREMHRPFRAGIEEACSPGVENPGLHFSATSWPGTQRIAPILYTASGLARHAQGFAADFLQLFQSGPHETRHGERAGRWSLVSIPTPM